ncbi:hypothetical protein [Citrobacter amalonaticus]|uniref:hypothetical protein n=1 Tax=Citrobacter amalonaticus TaxID=35703 RepID=UPI002432C341|nr:hypothetical protein [Citrobacter braakii]WGA84853.1 hypothetical protein NFL11_03375 [Citrobacter braakii]
MFAGKKSAQIREILISESAWEEMTCLFAPSLEQYNTFLTDYDWLDKKDEKQAIYCWEYLRNKNMIPFYLKPYNTAMRIQMIIACMDSWDTGVEEKYFFIQKMKHAWQQAVSSRKKDKK